MELLSKILIFILAIVLLGSVIFIMRLKKPIHTCTAQACPSCTTQACTAQACPSSTTQACTAQAMVTKQDLLKIFNILPDNFVFRSLTTRNQLETALNDPNLILPQNIPSLSPTQVKNLTDAQKFAIFIGYFALFSKVNFTVDQLSALTPQEIKSTVLGDFMILYTISIVIQVLNQSGNLSSDQITTMLNIGTNNSNG